MSIYLQMQECPRWSKCSAPLCPLDAQSYKSTMTRYDPTCSYMLEAVKRGAEARFKERGLEYLFAQVVDAIPAFCDRYGRIRRSLERAMLSGSKMSALKPEEREHESL